MKYLSFILRSNNLKIFYSLASAAAIVGGSYYHLIGATDNAILLVLFAIWLKLADK